MRKTERERERKELEITLLEQNNKKATYTGEKEEEKVTHKSEIEGEKRKEGKKKKTHNQQIHSAFRYRYLVVLTRFISRLKAKKSLFKRIQKERWRKKKRSRRRSWDKREAEEARNEKKTENCISF